MCRIKTMCRNIFHLGLKELLGLWRDPLMLILIVYSFSFSIYLGSNAQPDSLTKASIAVVDEDHSPLSERLTDSFMPPMFLPPKEISRAEIDPDMDKGKYTFVVVFPTNFYRDVLAAEPSKKPGWYRWDLTAFLTRYGPHLSHTEANNLFFTTSALRDVHYAKQKNNAFYHMQAMDLPFQNIEFHYLDLANWQELTDMYRERSDHDASPQDVQ